MTEVNDIDFPISTTFQKGHWTKSFASLEEIQEWYDEEINGWVPLQNGNFANKISFNRNILMQSNLNKLREPKDILNKPISISTKYLPLASVSSLIATIGDPNQCGPIIAQIISPHSFNDAASEAVATVFLSYGSPNDLLSRISESQAEIEKMRGDVASLKEQQQEQLLTYRKKCEEFFDSFATKIALSKPRDYWDKRAAQHGASTQLASIVWNGTLIVLFGAAVMFLVDAVNGKIDISLPKENTTLMVGILLERVAIGGTFLGLVVWWLRQKLRDLRSHDHLAEDASERVTMIDTYNALKQAGLQDADLTPVLNALYRPGTTGLVEDGGPVLPFGILIKTAEKLSDKP